MKRAAIYARVSTDEQAEKSSLSSQFEECRKYAVQQGLTVVEEISDDISGSLPVVDRPGGSILQNRIDDQVIDAIVVYRVDRLSRRLGDLISTVERWLESGVVLYILDIGLVKSANDITLVIKGWQGGDEWMKIAERTTGGRNDKARKEKKIVMSGHPPFGYRREGKGSDARLFIDENEAYIVKQIFSWYLQGDSESGPLSLRAIAAKLDETGAPTPHYRKNAANQWIPATIRGILLNEIYTGRTYYGKNRMVKKSEFQRHGKRTKQPKDAWIAIEVPELAIIEPAIFNQVQERAKRNQERATRNQKRQYLMTGHFRCGACGSAMSASVSRPSGYETIYYRCGNHWRSMRGNACEYASKTIVTSKVDGAVWDWIRDLLSDETTLREGIRAMRERAEDDLAPKQKRFDQISSMVNSRKSDLNRLIVELAEEELSVIRDAVKDRIRIMGKEIEALERETEELSKELNQKVISPEQEELLVATAAEIREELESPDFETQRYILDRLNLQAIFRDENGERWLDVKCELTDFWQPIMLYPWLVFSRH